MSIMALIDDLVPSVAGFISECREGKTWEATIKAMDFLRDYGTSFIGRSEGMNFTA